jgi:hypothetical protein
MRLAGLKDDHRAGACVVQLTAVADPFDTLGARTDRELFMNVRRVLAPGQPRMQQVERLSGNAVDTCPDSLIPLCPTGARRRANHAHPISLNLVRWPCSAPLWRSAGVSYPAARTMVGRSADGGAHQRGPIWSSSEVRRVPLVVGHRRSRLLPVFCCGAALTISRKPPLDDGLPVSVLPADLHTRRPRALQAQSAHGR